MNYLIKKTVSPHSYVMRMGFFYPIIFEDDPNIIPWFRELTDNLEREFGEPCSNYHFKKGYGTSFYDGFFSDPQPKDRRWFAGPVKWNTSSIWSPGKKHIVFRTEQDRTCARILIGK